MTKKRKLKRGTNVRAKKHVSTKPLPWNGDHGTGTAAANANTVLEPIKDSPNRMAMRRRVNVIDTLTSLTMRQIQAAKALHEAVLPGALHTVCRDYAYVNGTQGKAEGNPARAWLIAILKALIATKEAAND